MSTRQPDALASVKNAAILSPNRRWSNESGASSQAHSVSREPGHAGRGCDARDGPGRQIPASRGWRSAPPSGGRRSRYWRARADCRESGSVR